MTKFLKESNHEQDKHTKKCMKCGKTFTERESVELELVCDCGGMIIPKKYIK